MMRIFNNVEVKVNNSAPGLFYLFRIFLCFQGEPRRHRLSIKSLQPIYSYREKSSHIRFPFLVKPEWFYPRLTHVGPEGSISAPTLR